MYILLLTNMQLNHFCCQYAQDSLMLYPSFLFLLTSENFRPLCIESLDSIVASYMATTVYSPPYTSLSDSDFFHLRLVQASLYNTGQLT